MIRFTDQEIIRLRRRAKEDPSIISRLKKSCEAVFSRPVTIPQTALGTWSLFYYCPEHSVPLRFDIDNPAVRWMEKFLPESPTTAPGGAAATE